MKKSSYENRRIDFAILVSMFLSITFCVFEPVKSYFANHDEYWFTLNRGLKLYIACAAIGIILCLLLYMVLSVVSKKVANLLFSFMFFVAVGLYIQGNFIPNTLGALDGGNVDWKRINIDMICSDILWLIIVVLCFTVVLVPAVRNNIISVATTVSICFLLLEAVVCVFLNIQVPNVNYKYDLSITDVKEFDVSKKENFVILVLDAFDSSYLDGAVEDNRAKEIFSDFTFYSNAMSMYGHTDLSLPQMITGNQYKNETSYESYLKDSYNNSPLLNRLNNENWDMGIYIEGHIPKCEMASNLCNVKDIDCGFISKRHFLETQYKVVAFSVVPYHMKKMFWFLPDFVDLEDSPSDEYDLYSYYNGDFYDDMDNIDVNTDKSVFRFYHIRGMHLPMHTTKDVEEQYEHVSMEECREANYKIIERYLNYLKENDVYDNSNIIIMADHGESSDDTGEWKQNPILLIKGKNEHHKFKQSDISISYDDLQTIYENLLNGKTELDVFDGVDTSTGRARLFYRYFYGGEAIGKAGFPDITEYQSTDVAAKITGLVPTGNVYSSVE